MRLTLTAITAALLCACAKSPESIAPSYVSPVAYEGYSCEQLRQEYSRVYAALATASKQQQQARNGDTVGGILLGLPVSSMSGEAIAPEVARLKGEKQTIEQAMISRPCTGTKKTTQ